MHIGRTHFDYIRTSLILTILFIFLFLLFTFYPSQLLFQFKSNKSAFDLTTDTSTLPSSKLTSSKLTSSKFSSSKFSSLKFSSLKLTTATAQLQPQDPKYSQQQSSLSTISLESAWDTQTGSKNVVVAVIDDSIDINHPDLRDNIGPGWDFVEGDNDPSPGQCNLSGANDLNENESHGTKVAGVIGAVANNSIGVSGVNWNVTIMPLRIGCNFQSDKEMLAIEYAIANGADIINLSYGTPITTTFIQNNFEKLKQTLAAAEKQVLVVVSAGNYHVNNDDIGMYPANIELDNVISVAASDINRQLTHWSQYGAASVDFAAPGIDLTTTRAATTTNNSEYESVSGTSFSAPVVSGVAALLKAKNMQNGNVKIEPAEIKAILQASVSDLIQQKGVLKTDGLINAANALSILNSPRPVITIEGFNYDDSTPVTASVSQKNGLIDPNESGMLNINVKNLWDNVVNANVTLLTEDNSLSVGLSNQNVGYWAKGDLKTLSFQIDSEFYSGHKRFPFKLVIEAVGERGTSTVEREFFINTGILSNRQLQNGIIQRNSIDDYQNYHFNTPAGTQNVSIEVTYNPNDTRDIGLLASVDKKPQIHFAKRNSTSYWYKSDVISDAISGFERIDLALPSRNLSNDQTPTVNAMVFNAPATSSKQIYANNKAYTIKACYFSDDDGNLPPVVSAGIDRTVLAGTTVTLNGVVSDSDGKITRQWWNALDGTPLLSANGTEITFIAPAKGESRFTLTAIDNGCKLARDTVVIKIEDESGVIPGFQLNPAKLVIEENSSIDLIVTAIDGTTIIDNITMTSKIDGLSFIKSNDETRGNRLIWQNAGPIGKTKIAFTANVGGETKDSFISVEIVARGQNNRGGGCSAIEKGNFDPLFLIYLLLSFYFLKKSPFRDH